MAIDPMPAIESWSVSSSVVAATLSFVRPAGRDGREAGVLWVGRRQAAATVDAIVVPHGEGVIEEEGRWEIPPELFGTVGRWARPRGWSLLAVCHTHGDGVPARLSRIDRTHLVRAPGMLAIVIGRGGAEDDPHHWGWYVFDGGEYRELATEHSDVISLGGDGAAELWRADRFTCEQVVPA